jgi:hypothetical protein
MTLEDYLRDEAAQGKIDFSLRVHTIPGNSCEIYIHPTGRDGTTTPMLLVEGNTVRLHPGSSAPGWEHA